ncbi:MAG TPA: prephenate dehydrogenase/arogenate dehydrogenase family protein [Smithellaceae bacterium]|nr:prephenate dehydrogenase/arogenate dehydrogenase family protein [Smithellaceae bacterium]
MKDISIGIIGGTGGMGRWLADLLQKGGYQVIVLGRKTKMPLDELTSSCAVVVVSVPIAATADVIKQVGPLMPAKSLLMDLTSLKKEPVELMLANSQAEVIGCHPLFGPNMENPAGQNIVLCQARGNKWYDWLKKLWLANGLQVLETSPERHDAIMAIVQALNHLNTITLGLALAETAIPLNEIKKYSTPIFQTKEAIVKKIFTESPLLYKDIIIRNPDVGKILDIYDKALADIRRAIQSRNSDEFKDLLEKTAKILF